MKRLNFYFKYAWRSVLRSGQRSFFAILCIAVGVAALVALQVLGASIQDTLTGDTKAQAGGDIVLRPTRSTSSFGGTSSSSFTQSDFDVLDRFKATGTITEWTPLVNQSNLRLKGYFSFPPTLYAVNPATYPLYGKLDILQPGGKNLRDLISAPGTAVVSKNLFGKMNLKVGETLEMTGSNGQAVNITIAGESDVVLPGVIFGPGQFFGYVITSQQTAATMYEAADLTPVNIFVKAPPGANLATLKNLIVNSGHFRGDTANEIQANLSRGLDITQDFLSYIGLLSLLVGGIGVINTMLVVIGRRTTEIATVKALGLKTRQTLFIFTLEALILGVMGSILGIFLGEILGLAIKGVAEGFFARPLAWQLYPGPIIVGLIVGVLTSGVFGFLPSYAAARVRPAVVLRSQTSFVPNIGGFAALVIVILMDLAIGVIAGVLLKNLMVGLIVSLITLVVLALMVAGLWIIIWLVGLLPAPPTPSVKMAFRSFSRHRGRTATTLLVMVVGLFFISFITFVADSVKSAIRDALDVQLGYNAIGFGLNLTGTSDTGPVLQNVNNLRQIPGMQKVFPGNFATARFTTSTSNSVTRTSVSVSGRSYIDGQTASGNKSKILAGRDLTPADADANVLLLTKSAADEYNLKVGDSVTLQPGGFGPGPGLNRGNTGGTSTQFTVIGIKDAGNQIADFEGDWVAPYNAVARLGSPVTLYYLLIDRAQKQAALEKTQNLISNVFDLDDLIDTFNRLLDQILAFPLILSLLSLFSGAILVANNVALAVLERRTEIGVLKAVGAKRRRVMGILLWESGMVGLLGGLIGVGAGILIAINVNNISNIGNSNPSDSNALPVTWSPGVAALLILLGIGLALVATLVSAWGAVQEKPLVVLRYE